MGIYEEILRELPGSGRGVVGRSPFGLIELQGADAVEFVHRLCSQDVAGMADGDCRPGTFLTPKGKLITTAVIARRAGGVLVEAQAGVLAELAELLERYHFTEKLTVVARPGPCAELVGRGAPAAVGLAPWRCGAAGEDTVILCGERFGVSWARCHGTPDAVSGWVDGLGAPQLAPELAECLRILAGQVRIGADTDASTLALEAGLDDHVSTTKGCYTGQEIVARIHTYGHVNRRLVLLRLAAAEVPPQTVLCETGGGEPVGRVTSAAPLREGAASVGLGYLPEAFTAPGSRLWLGDAGGPAVEVERWGPG